jgi:energy-coupling factor transporter ATP-binding protein EcfA2
MTPILDFQGIARSFQRGARVLDGVTFSMQPGEVAGLLGGSGSEKTALIRIAMGMLHPHAGTVRVFGISEGAGAVLSSYLVICNGTWVFLHHGFRRLKRGVRARCYVASVPALYLWGSRLESKRGDAVKALPASGAGVVVFAGLLFWTATRWFRAIEILKPRYVSAWESMSQK